jgi:aspartyl-tRNA(Asn)/glutamyl-tRNA(Gln) amidotransferase subunit A
VPIGFGLVDGQTFSPFQVMNATSILSLTGNPAMTLRFGTSHNGLPIGVQIVSSWYSESTMFNVASILEDVSAVRDLHAAI